MTLHIFLMLFIMAAVVIFLRFFPFIVFSGGRKVPPIVEYLGTTVTAAAIAMLVIYSFYGSLEYSLEGFSRFLPAAAASILTVILQYFFKNPLVSIIAGTALFMYPIR